MERHLLISSDCHAGLPPGGYREYLDPSFREAFDAAHAEQIRQTVELERHFLVKDINVDWREGRESALTGAWDHAERIKVLDGDGCAGEIQWAKENGLGSIMIPVLWGDHAPYHHPCYDPLWTLCQDLDMPIHFHSGPADSATYFGSWPPVPGEETLRGAMGIYVSEVAWWVARPLTFLIWAGVFELFPKLKVAITEGTAAWVPSYLELLDQRATAHAGNSKLGDFTSHLKLKPSEYFARNVRIGAMAHRNEVEARHEIGVNVLMWGSDYPHPEGSWPETESRLATSFTGVPEAERDAILGGNALAFYGFDAEKLAPIVARVGPEKKRFEA